MRDYQQRQLEDEEYQRHLGEQGIRTGTAVNKHAHQARAEPIVRRSARQRAAEERMPVSPPARRCKRQANGGRLANSLRANWVVSLDPTSSKATKRRSAAQD